MVQSHGWDVRPVRSLFVSDVHLGCRHAQADAFLEVLNYYEPDYLYLVGDFLDGWKLARRWRWNDTYTQIFRRLCELSRNGTLIRYAAGNHDEFLRGFMQHFGMFEVADDFIHIGADNRRYLVIHGDRFDKVESQAKWLSKGSSLLYDSLLSLNWLLNRLRGKRHAPYVFCGWLKRSIKHLVKFFSDFENKLVAAAHDYHCEGVICGHIHAPKIKQIADLAYCNTGDWVESCTALVELDDGGMEIIHYFGGPGDRLAPLDEHKHQRQPVRARANPQRLCQQATAMSALLTGAPAD